MVICFGMSSCSVVVLPAAGRSKTLILLFWGKVHKFCIRFLVWLNTVTVARHCIPWSSCDTVFLRL